MEECMIVRKDNLGHAPEKCRKCKKIFNEDEKFYCFGTGDSIADFFCINCVNETSPLGQRTRPMTMYSDGQ
jgi:DNA-binding MltR family transcriptional regulator